MKKTFAILAAAFLAGTLSFGQNNETYYNNTDFSFNHTLVCNPADWTPDDVAVKGSTQGFAMYGKYAFIFHDKGQCVVVDYKNGKFINTFHMGVTDDCHCNNASFGKDRAANSKFPLLYLSECRGRHACFVYNIGLDGATLVQTILLDSNPFGSSFDWCVDADEGYIYAYGGVRSGSKFLRKFRLPKLNESDANGEVHLTEKDVLQTVEIPGLYIFQGSKVKDGYAYLTQGYPPYQLSLWVVNLKTAKVDAVIDLNGLGLEPEGLDIRGKKLYTVHHTSKTPKASVIYSHDLKR